MNGFDRGEAQLSATVSKNVHSATDSWGGESDAHVLSCPGKTAPSSSCWGEMPPTLGLSSLQWNLHLGAGKGQGGCVLAEMLLLLMLITFSRITDFHE